MSLRTKTLNTSSPIPPPRSIDCSLLRRALLWSREGRRQACDYPKLAAALEAAAEAASQRGDGEGARQLGMTRRELGVYSKRHASDLRSGGGVAPPSGSS